MLSFGFPPISSPSARVLIIGSLPGRLSLERGEYYAHPQNAFWKMIAARIPDLPSGYAGRVAALIERRIALWDVLAAATRSGSLDAAIAEDAIANNFRAFFHVHAQIELIAFNGAAAAQLYARHALPTFAEAQRELLRVTLPSTSGAHAGLELRRKVRSLVSALELISYRRPSDEHRQCCRNGLRRLSLRAAVGRILS